jgi:hypothetical protein
LSKSSQKTALDAFLKVIYVSMRNYSQDGRYEGVYRCGGFPSLFAIFLIQGATSAHAHCLRSCRHVNRSHGCRREKTRRESSFESACKKSYLERKNQISPHFTRTLESPLFQLLDCRRFGSWASSLTALTGPPIAAVSAPRLPQNHNMSTPLIGGPDEGLFYQNFERPCLFHVPW